MSEVFTIAVPVILLISFLLAFKSLKDFQETKKDSAKKTMEELALGKVLFKKEEKLKDS